MVLGVFETLRKENADLISSKKVEIIQSSFWSDLNRYSGTCLVNDNHACFLCTKNEQNSYVIIRLVNSPILVRGIKLGSRINDYAPLSWVIEGSNDNIIYEPIFSISESICDKFDNSTDHLCDGQFNKTYNIPKTKPYEYFKISQIGANSAIYSKESNWANYIYSLRLSLVEFYLTNPILITHMYKCKIHKLLLFTNIYCFS